MRYLRVYEYDVDNGDGWDLFLKQTLCPEVMDSSKPPLLLIPGYGMNSFIFGYHPKGTSMERVLAEAGFEVWSVDLRGQGRSVKRRGGGALSLRAYAEVDLKFAVEHIVKETQTELMGVVMVGCSLGGSLAYAHMALVPEHRVLGVMAIGSPLRWTKAPGLLRIPLKWPTLVGLIHVKGARTLARTVFPLLVRTIPEALGIYMNPAHVDMSHMPRMIETVDDPSASVNKEVAIWLKTKDLMMGSVNITESMRDHRVPLLVVLANRDGIVPPEAVSYAVDVWGGEATLLRIGDDRRWYAHADLFIGDHAPKDVFAPLIAWLNKTF